MQYFRQVKEWLLERNQTCGALAEKDVLKKGRVLEDLCVTLPTWWAVTQATSCA